VTFFDGEVAEKGMVKCIEEYCFHREILPRFLAGVFHNIIHVGYGVEFNIPLLVAEGIAMSCLHENYLAPITDS